MVPCIQWWSPQMTGAELALVKGVLDSNYLNEGKVTEDFEQAKLVIGIFMSPLDVHYNRAPIASTIGFIRRHPAIGRHPWPPHRGRSRRRSSVRRATRSGKARTPLRRL